VIAGLGAAPASHLNASITLSGAGAPGSTRPLQLEEAEDHVTVVLMMLELSELILIFVEENLKPFLVRETRGGAIISSYRRVIGEKAGKEKDMGPFSSPSMFAFCSIIEAEHWSLFSLPEGDILVRCCCCFSLSTVYLWTTTN
jgi:hypothetical protein